MNKRHLFVMVVAAVIFVGKIISTQIGFKDLLTPYFVSAQEVATSVSSFTLVNADTDTVIQTLKNGATVNVATLPTKNLNIKANTNPSTVGSVRFGYDGQVTYSIESMTPYAFAGDTSGDYNAWTPATGSHTLVATPYSLSGAAGTAGTPLSITFTVTNDAQTQSTQSSPNSSTSAENSNSTETQTETQTETSLTILEDEGTVSGPPQISSLRVQTGSSISQYDKYEVAFDLSHTQFTNPYYPYDANPPAGVPAGVGVTVNMRLTQPGGATKTIPCFYYQPYKEIGSGNNARLEMIGKADWRCRVSGASIGNYSYQITAQDKGGTSSSASGNFSVKAGSNKGYIKVSSTDSRYFEYGDGTPFVSPLINIEKGNVSNGDPWNTIAAIKRNVPKLANNGIHFVRWWPNSLGANPMVAPFGDQMGNSWGYGPDVWSQIDVVDTARGNQFSFSSYYYTVQSVPVESGSTYKVTLRAYVSGDQVLRVSIGNAKVDVCSASTSWHTSQGQTCSQSANGWQDVTLNFTASNTGTAELRLSSLYKNSDAPAPYNIVRTGLVRMSSVSVERDETGNGGWGPNLVTRGDPDTHRYVDQPSAARLDEILELSEQYGLYHRVPIFDKNDRILNSIADNGSILSTWDQDNKVFYSAPGKPARWLRDAYLRYFIGRWTYSSALHSTELSNEDHFPWSYEAIYTMMQQVKNNASRPIMAAPSFHTWWVDSFWADKTYGALADFSDKHWYATRTGSSCGSDGVCEVISNEWDDSAAYTRECTLRFQDYSDWNSYTKPIIRGEGGTAISDTNVQDPAIAGEPQGIYYHKKLWANVGNPAYMCDGEWYTRLFETGGSFPNSSVSLIDIYRSYENFLKGEPLSNGRYVSIGTDMSGNQNMPLAASSGAMRAWGVRDTAAGKVLLWIDNPAHTWNGVVKGSNVATAAGTIAIPGLSANTAFTVEWWDTYNRVSNKPITKTETVQSNSSGVLALSVSNLTKDVAVKIYNASGAVVGNMSPTISLTSPVSVNQFSAPATVSLAATASDTDGSVSKVEFFQGSTLLYSDTNAPYSYSWNAVGEGTYTLSARATDNEGATTTSAAVTITVGTVAPIATDGWPMVAANVARTSWVPEQVPDNAYLSSHSNNGKLSPAWYTPIEPYVPNSFQVIAANNLLYVSSAKGLYAFNESGKVAWVYPTALPLGNSPTIVGTKLFVGGMDGHIHELNALTGERIALSPAAGAGFGTNPLVVDNVVYMGNRDGRFYAWTPGSNNWKWQYPRSNQSPLDGPITISAAYDETAKTIHFGGADGRAYALSESGSLLWRSAQFPTQGFQSWWPVLKDNTVIYAGAPSLRSGVYPLKVQEGELLKVQLKGLAIPTGIRGTPLWPVQADKSLDTSKSYVGIKSMSDYYEAYPGRRMTYVLDSKTGQEKRYDLDNDGVQEYAPWTYVGTRDGARYPAVVGGDGVLYESSLVKADDYIPAFTLMGWPNTSSGKLYPAGSSWLAEDEGIAYSAGGNFLYWNQLCDRAGGAINISIPNSSFPNVSNSREWRYYDYTLRTLMPGYDAAHEGYDTQSECQGAFGGLNGVYGNHTVTQNPPIPYHGSVFFHRSNSLMSFSTGSYQGSNPEATTRTPQSAVSNNISATELSQRLDDEVAKMITAGHLRPGWGQHGNMIQGISAQIGDNYQDYYHNPSDTQITLLRALPYLSAERQTQVKTYLQNEMKNYPVYQYSHVGWASGASRDAWDLDPESKAALSSYGPTAWSGYDFPGWTTASNGSKMAPYLFYALWKYADAGLGNAKTLFDASKNLLSSPPSDATLARLPNAHNAYIAGYMGYLELQKLAGYPETASVRTELNRLLALRANTFSKDQPFGTGGGINGSSSNRGIAISRNFIHMVPELAEYLKNNASARSKVAAAVSEYENAAPYWFVGNFEGGWGESTQSLLYDRLLFSAKAWILDDSQTDLVNYVDAPAFKVGDLMYIDNLVSAIEAGGTIPTPPDTPAPTPEDTTAPIISNIQTANITTTGATISWTTDESADTQIEYGLTTSYGSQTTLNGTRTTSHTATLTNLQSGTTYHYRVKSKDAAGNLKTSSDRSFTTSNPTDTTAPIISNIQASNITVTGATISWTTNESADTQVEYGQTTSYGSQTALVTSLLTNHSVMLSGLQSNTTYQYRVKSKDAAGNIKTSASQSFTTLKPADTTAPTISAIHVSNITTTGATITWTTNESATSQIAYGTTNALGTMSTSDARLITNHAQTIGGLSADTTYHYRVISLDQAGNQRMSAIATFKTTPVKSNETQVAVEIANITKTVSGTYIISDTDGTELATGSFVTDETGKTAISVPDSTPTNILIRLKPVDYLSMTVSVEKTRESSVTLSPKVGDFDGDGKIDATDKDVFIERWKGNNINNGDFNGDGAVNALDYSVFFTNWNKQDE